MFSPLLAAMSTQSYHALSLEPITDMSQFVLHSTSDEAGQADTEEHVFSDLQSLCRVCARESLGVSGLNIDGGFTIWKSSLVLSVQRTADP